MFCSSFASWKEHLASFMVLWAKYPCIFYIPSSRRGSLFPAFCGAHGFDLWRRIGRRQSNRGHSFDQVSASFLVCWCWRYQLNSIWTVSKLCWHLEFDPFWLVRLTIRFGIGVWNFSSRLVSSSIWEWMLCHVRPTRWVLLLLENGRSRIDLEVPTNCLLCWGFLMTMPGLSGSQCRCDSCKLRCWGNPTTWELLQLTTISIDIAIKKFQQLLAKQYN